jgi:co-chaperonin GroES (HSP10)
MWPLTPLTCTDFCSPSTLWPDNLTRNKTISSNKCPYKNFIKTEGGIVKATQTIRDEEVSNISGYVLKLGPDCYKDKNRFPSGPWCKKGDWVVFRAYSGTRMKMYGKEFRLINDDTVEAVVEDPTGVVRAWVIKLKIK